MNTPFLLSVRASLVALAGVFAMTSAHSAVLYWDSNGATAGAGLDPSGTWGTDAYWSTSQAGTNATANTPTTTADDLRFSAGSDTTGTYVVTLNGVQSAGIVQARTGSVTLTGGTLAMVRNATNGSPYLDTIDTANLTVSSTLSVNNTAAGNSFLNFRPASGTTITLNGPVEATGSQIIFIRHNGTGTVVINSNLGSNASFASAIASDANAINGAATGGVLTLNGQQDLVGSRIYITDGSKTGTVNLGATVTASTVSLSRIDINSSSADLSGATVNINSDVTLGAAGTGVVNVRNGGILNVAGKLTAGNVGLGTGATGNTYHGGAIHILQGGVANVGAVSIADGLTLTNEGTLTGSTLTLGEAASNTSGRLVLGGAGGAGSGTFVVLTTAGSGGNNSLVGGSSSISTFTLNSSASNSDFTGRIGGDGTHENNVALVKEGTSTLTLSGVNTYIGDTTVNAGTFTLSSTGSMNFKIGDNGVNNWIHGTGTAVLNGNFTFDLSGAAIADGNSWTIVDMGHLTASYGLAFAIQGFSDEGGGIWSKTDGSNTWTFAKSSGILSLDIIPEPATWMLLLGATSLLCLRRKRRE